MKKVQAASIDFTEQLYKSIGGQNTQDYQAMTVADFVQPILNVVYGIAFIILLINLVLVGLKMTSKSQKGLEEAKKNLMYTFIGLLLVVFAFIITNVLAGLFIVNT